MSNSHDSLSQIIEVLRGSPMFHLSLAAKELFHSNFLAWMCETYPDSVGKLFALYLSEAPGTFTRVEAHRENHRVDITLKYENGQTLLIENKVKSLPRMEQLDEISGKVKARNRETTNFLLLTLVQPGFSPPNARSVQLGDGSKWHCITYRTLANALNKFLPAIVERNRYHGELFKDYLALISALDRLQSHFAIDWRDERADFFLLDELKELRSIRLHDVVGKVALRTTGSPRRGRFER